MNFLVTCKYEEDPIKNEGARLLTTFSPLFSNSFEMLWMSHLPASMKKIRSKIESLECS